MLNPSAYLNCSLLNVTILCIVWHLFMLLCPSCLITFSQVCSCFVSCPYFSLHALCVFISPPLLPFLLCLHFHLFVMNIHHSSSAPCHDDLACSFPNHDSLLLCLSLFLVHDQLLTRLTHSMISFHTFSPSSVNVFLLYVLF